MLILDEYDTRLAGLKVDVLVSLHADSCVQASGNKVATAKLLRISRAALYEKLALYGL